MAVSEQNIITWRIHPTDMPLLVRMAKAACIGGGSHIRDGQSRQDALQEDQLVGQIGQYVGSLWLYGSTDPYKQSRWLANLRPTEGDGGSDVIGANIDFKTSRVRNTGRDLLQYRLAVRPRERHTGWIYFLILVTHLCKGEPVIAKMVGWAADDMLPEQPETTGVFSGAFTLPAHQLHPVPPIHWLWNKV
jgi:hypothetical protein